MQCELCKFSIPHSGRFFVEHCRYYSTLGKKQLMLLAAEIDQCSFFELDSKEGPHFEREIPYEKK
jgi:hypothetical protein